MASGKLQALCYKHEIENLRTPEYAFSVIELNDYSGQGTALWVLNAFWEEKAYVNAAEFVVLCSDCLAGTHGQVCIYEQ